MSLKDLPASDFPLRYEEYSDIYDRLQAASAKFSALGYEDLAEALDGVTGSLNRAWELIVETERAGE